MHESYFTVSKFFPAHRPLIQHLFRSSHVFRETCIDYHKCFKALHYWSKSLSQEAPLRKQEYSTLLSELKQEILQSVRHFDEDITAFGRDYTGEHKR